MAGTTSINYVPLYQHVLDHKDGHKCFTGSRSDKDYWNRNRLELEKEVLRKRAHLSQTQKSKSGKSHPAVVPNNRQSSGTSDGKTTRQRHNAKCRKAYNSRKKAKKAALKAEATVKK